jgi:hypothetical protein
LDRPTGGKEEVRAYLQKEMNRIRDYYDKAVDFYHYYRSGSTHMDHFFFLRHKPKIQMNIESFYFERDPKFSTSHDFMVAKILGNNLLEEYLQQELKLCMEAPSGASPLRVKLTWTAKKIFLIELAYALYLAQVFNHGRATLREIKNYLEDVFNTDLGANPSVYYTEMKMRKERTSFLNQLKDLLKKKMDDDDQK